MTEEFILREQICEIGYNLWQRGMVAANDGNISARLKDGTFLATPTGVSKSKLTPAMLIKINENYEVLESAEGYSPSSEFKLHLVCYRERPDVNAVVHAHPPIATGYAVANVPLDDYSMTEAVTFLGSVPLAPYGAPGSKKLSESVVSLLPYHDAILLSNHGAVTVGTDLTQAYYRMETLEHYAKVSLTARLLGGAKELPREEIEKCCEIAKGYPIRHPGYKKYSL